MRRQRIKLKLKRRRRDLTKKARVLCDFCGFSSRYEQRSHERDHEAVSMESELKRLRLLTRRMTAKDPEGLSFSELLLLDSHLREGLLIVKEQRKKIEKKEEVERLRKQEEAAEDEDNSMSGEVLVHCKVFSSGCEERQEKQAPQPPSQMQIAFERRKAESMEMEFERLWLLKERMNGRELDGMNCAELNILIIQMGQALLDLHSYRFAPKMELDTRQKREELISQLRDVPGAEHER